MKRKKPTLQAEIKIPLWDCSLSIIIGGDHIDIMALAKEKKLSDPIIREIDKDKSNAKNTAGSAYFCLDEAIGILWFPTKRVPVDVMAHEATHIVDELLKFLGAETESEARAYTVGWIVGTVPGIIKNMK
jgi:hypothetical protein